MPCRRSPDYKSSSSTWMEKREEGGRGSWLHLLFLSSAQVSAALPVFLATGVERGPACWGMSVGGGVCLCVGGKSLKGVLAPFWLCLCVLAATTASAASKGPLRLRSGACTIVQTPFASLVFLFSLFFVFFLFCGVFSLSLWLWDTDWVNETWD